MPCLYKTFIGRSAIWLAVSLPATRLLGQSSSEEDAFFIKSLFGHALHEQKAYAWLHYLSENIGGRIAGSPQCDQAIAYTCRILDSIPGVRVHKQPCTVNYWYRGNKQKVVAKPSKGKSQSLRALALGWSGAGKVKAEVVQFKSLDELRANPELARGKVVFLNRPFDNRHFRTFHAYGAAVDQRVSGPNLAAKLGARACIVRSMTGRTDPWPHTGSTFFEEGVKPIPALAISTMDADLLERMLNMGSVEVCVHTNCENRGPKTSYTVIGEILGNQFPDEIILVGGHLDSWDVGGGAHDDGAGVVHAMEVLHLLVNAMHYTPKRTIRCVLFQNEENGLAGALTYAEVSNGNKEYHLAAIESDAGGFTPQAFGFDADTSVIKMLTARFQDWEELFSPYDIHFKKGGGGADIGPLKSQKGLLIGLQPDSQRYFDYHHTEQDRIAAVHPRELALGSAAMASLVYLIDKYGLKKP